MFMTVFVKQRAFICIVITSLKILAALVEYIQYFQEINLKSMKHRPEIIQLFIVNTTGCKIPYLDPDNEDIIKHKDITTFPCLKYVPLIKSNTSSLYVNTNALKIYGISNVNSIKCFYQPFWRKTPKGNQDDKQVEYGKSMPFDRSTNILHEFVKVECTFSGSKYIDYHSFVPFK